MEAFLSVFASLSPIDVLAQIFGFAGIAVSLIIYAPKTRSKILVCKFISDVLWFLNYLLVGAYTGAVLNVVAMGRETVFYNRERKKWADHLIWLYVFIAITLLSPILELIKSSELSLIPLLPAVGSVFAVISFYSKKPSVMRIFGFIAQVFWLAYGICIFNISAVICNVLTITSALIGTVRDMRAGADSK